MLSIRGPDRRFTRRGFRLTGTDGRALRGDFRLGLDRLQPCDYLALLDAITFDDQNLGDTCGPMRIRAQG